jgi:2-polyprenyl-3-methyl-5-hydroxy-6-metoxy-1,4-benzoquinol methylase
MPTYPGSADSARCPLCEGTLGADIPYAGPTQDPSLRFDSILLCGSCGLGVAWPRPSQESLDAFYRAGAYWHATGAGRAQRAHATTQSRQRVAQCLACLEPTRSIVVADIGAGHGSIAYWLSKLHPEGVARYDFLEPDENAARSVLALEPGFEVRRVRSVADLGRGYDLLFVNHVLEHVAAPVEFMQSLLGHLAADGIGYIETPNSDYRYKDDVYPHTLFFTRTAFAALAGRIGAIQLRCDEFGAWPGSPGGLSAGRYRLLAGIFHLAASVGWHPLEALLDRMIWRYDNTADGIWLRCIVRRQG